MAYRKRRSSRPKSRRSSGSYRPSRRKSGLRSSGSRVQTVRIQLVGPQTPNVIQTASGPMSPAAAPRRASF